MTETESSLAEARTTVKETKDNYLRLMADMENLRSRTKREVEQAKLFALQSFAKDLLEVPDNLDRALEAVPGEVASGSGAVAETDYYSKLKTLFDGVKMVSANMNQVMKRAGIERVDCAVGSRFDPHTMNALFEFENPNLHDMSVGQIVKTGYALNGRIIRPAEVGVSKGGEPFPSEESSTTNDKSSSS